MKIEWIEGEREVPGVGLMQTGDIRNVPSDIGQNLIRQGVAKIPKEKKEVKGGTE